MARPREFDEQKAMAAATQLFWEKGYEATSISDLTSRMEIQRPSLYAAFGGKKELFETVLKAYIQMSIAYIGNKLHSAPSVKEAFHAYFYGIIEGSGGNNPDYGCLCVNTMVEMAPHDQGFAQFTRSYQSGLTELFRQAVEGGMRSGELSASLNASSIARLFTVTAIGLSVTMKTRPERALVDNTVAEILTLLE